MLSKIIGHVLDNNKQPVDKVKISLSGKIVAVSKNDGFFSVSLTETKSPLALTFTKEGFVTNTKFFNSKYQCENFIIIWPTAYQCSFNSTRDFDVLLGGSRIQIPANSFLELDMKKTNSATLQFTLFDVTNPFHRRATSGNFSGKLLNGKISRLNSYGIFDFGITNKSNQKLKLRSGAEIKLSIPIPPRLIKLAPKSMGFFAFDTSLGIWNQIGSFNFAANAQTYNGSVVSFGGVHNLDDQQDTTCIRLKVIRMWDSAPMSNFHVYVDGLQYFSEGWTDSSGIVFLLVQRNASFTVTADGNIGTSNYGTPNPPTFISPDFSSDIGDCGDPVLCPLLGVIEVDLIVGGI
jgi:hypothetical protein